MDAVLKVRRFEPDTSGRGTWWQEYTLKDVPDRFTVLDALVHVTEEVDETLSLRYSCRSAVCGSCAVRINGRAGLACKTKLAAASLGGRPVTVEPMGNMAVLKDLVVHLEPHWEKVAAVHPYIQHDGPRPEREYLASNEAMLHLTAVMNCIMCGACVSDCTVLEVDKSFLGPAALAKAYRFVADPRDATAVQRLRGLNSPGGIWDCTRCNQCVQVCPKGVEPMERIMALRDRVIQAALPVGVGARHAEAFAEIVEHSGRLDELRLPLKTFGLFNLPKMMGLAALGLQALLRGKLPPIVHRPIPGAHNVRRIFKRVGLAQGVPAATETKAGSVASGAEGK